MVCRDSASRRGKAIVSWVERHRAPGRIPRIFSWLWQHWYYCPPTVQWLKEPWRPFLGELLWTKARFMLK